MYIEKREGLRVPVEEWGGPKTTARKARADGAELMQELKGGLIVADQHRLGDFELQPARRKAGGCQRASDLQRQRLAFQLNRRDVDGKPDMVGPGGRLGTGGSQPPFAEFIDQAGIFRNRYEFRRRGHAPFRMAAERQRLARGPFVGPGVEQR